MVTELVEVTLSIGLDKKVKICSRSSAFLLNIAFANTFYVPLANSTRLIICFKFLECDR